VFKGTSQNSQRRLGRSGKGEQAARARKLDLIFDARASKAVRGKLKNIDDAQKARAANRALKEKLRRDAIDPEKAQKRAEKIAARQAKRMRNVVVVKKKLR
jgi:hypothetical protein